MLPPIVERELRVALLRRKARREWMTATLTTGAMSLFFLLWLGAARGRYSGRTFFLWLFALACAQVVTRGFGLTTDLFSEERRNGTLGLLVLTGLSPLEIFLNKLLGAGMLAGYGLLGGLPFLALPFLAGGVSGTQFLCALAFLANGLLFCVAIGLLASVLHREGGQAQITAVIVTVLLSVTTPLAKWLGASSSVALVLSRDWLTLSPAHPPYLVFVNFAGGSARLFWMGSGFTLVYSLSALLAAAAVLHYTWREGPEALAPQGWRERWERRARGGERWRRWLRRRWMTRNPFCWLAARDRRPAILAQVFLILAALLGLAVWLALGGRGLRPSNAILISMVLHLFFSWFLAYAAGRRLAEERQSGGLEVLLTVPLEPAEIVEGQCRALLVQFRSVWITVFGADLLLCISGFAVPGWTVAAMASYILIWAVLFSYWFGVPLETASRAMWISTWTGRPAYAALQSCKGWFLPLFWFWVLSRAVIRFPAHAPPLGAVLLFAGFVCICMFIGFSHRRRLREQLARELRLIACAPIPARGDKRFKKWDPNLIHPPGRWGELVLQPAQPTSHTARHRPAGRGVVQPWQR